MSLSNSISLRSFTFYYYFFSFTPGMLAGALAEQVLAEIPKQALEYFEKNRILPNGAR